MGILNINGFTVLHYKKPTNIINVRVVVNVGAIAEEKNEYGVAHYLEHMFFKGTSKHNYKEINRITAELGDINAFTGRDMTVFHITSLKSDFKQAAGILSEMFFDLVFNDDEFKIEKGVITEEYQASMDNPPSYFWNMLTEGFWGSQRGHKILGNRNTISNMTIDNLKNFRERHYKVDNIVFTVVGNIEEAEVSSVFNELLQSVPSSHYEKLNSSMIEQDIVDYTDFIFKHKAKQAVMGFMGKGLSTTEQYDNNYCINVMKVGIGGGMHSLLFDRIREELGLCYSVGASIDSFIDTGHIIIYCLLDDKNIERAKDEILLILNKVKKEGFDDDLLRISKKNLLFDLADDFDDARGYSHLMFDNYFKNGCKLIDFNEREKRINSVTNDDIIKLANEIFKDGQLKFAQMTTEG